MTRAFGSKREARGYHAYSDMMDLWTLHMQIQHPEHEQPQWQLSADIDPALVDVENAFFEPQPLSAEEKLLREIFGEPDQKTRRHREHDLNAIRKKAAKLGHTTSLPADKVSGVCSASQGWVCTCGAGDPTPSSDIGAIREAARAHLLNVFDEAVSELRRVLH